MLQPVHALPAARVQPNLFRSHAFAQANESCETALAVYISYALAIRPGESTVESALRAQVSYRSMNLKDEPFLVEIVKDALCYVAADSRAESRRAFPKNRSQVAMEYVLPDGISSARGHPRDPRDPACDTPAPLVLVPSSPALRQT